LEGKREKAQQKQKEKKMNENFLTRLWRWLVPGLILVGIWVMPCPEALNPKAWHMFAIFAAMIAGILTNPLPSGALLFLSLALALFTSTINIKMALAGFSSATVWLIFCAYTLSQGFISSGLGRRVAFTMLSKFGGSSLGVAYALGIADLCMASAMPSVTARGGGIIMPMAKSINLVMDSPAGVKGKRIGDFLMMTCFQFTPITGAIFLTGMAASSLCPTLAAENFGVSINWGNWFMAACVPGFLCFLLMPLLSYKVLNPELKKTPEAKAMGREELRKMGPMTRREKLIAFGFISALIGWGTSLLTGINGTAVGIGLVSFLFVTHAVEWRDVLKDGSTWDTVIWFGAIISLATALAQLGFLKWLSAQFAVFFSGIDPMIAFIALGAVYLYLHYMFATCAAHVVALYVPIVSIVIASGIDPLFASLVFGILTNLMWGLTEYGSGPGPLYFGQGYFTRPRFYSLSLLLVSFSFVVAIASGLVWWKVIGLY
jgi:divalent anion:Na+ symporter, DASS family